MRADDYIGGIEGFDRLPSSAQTDLLAQYLLTHGGAPSVGAATLASLRMALRLSEHARLASYLSESTRRSKNRKPKYVKAKNGYVLEREYAAQLQASYLGRPATRHLAASLRGTLSAIGDPAVKLYLEEGVGAFEHGHHRAALVLVWCVAYGLLRDWLFRNHLAQLNVAMASWKTPGKISTLDDFQELTEGLVIDTSRKAKILTKEQHKTLKHLLDQRNSYAHPTTKPITPAITEAYIDTVVREIFPTFG